jgi:competence protein ComEC
LWPARVPALSKDGKDGQGGQGGKDGKDGKSSASITDEGSPENNASIAMMVEVSGLKLLMTGDLEPESQRAVVATGADLRADVLKVPHHGSSQQDPGFIAATQARLAVISAGVDNDYGHPAPRTLELLSRQGMQIARTDTSGSVAILKTGKGLSLTEKGSSAP